MMKIKKKARRKLYEVSLCRSYNVKIEAVSATQAKHLVEYWLDDPKDSSTKNDQRAHNFKIDPDIKLSGNDATYVEEIPCKQLKKIATTGTGF